MQKQRVPVTGLILMALIAFSMSAGDLAARFAPRTDTYPPVVTAQPASPAAPSSVVVEQEALVEHLSSKYNLPAQFVNRIVKAAYHEAYRVRMSPLLVLAVIEKESGLNPKATSGYGAVGLMQVVPRFHRDKLAGNNAPDGAYNPEVNIRVGTTILADYRKAHGGDIRSALTQYSGQARGYAQRVVSYKQELEAVTARAVRPA